MGEPDQHHLGSTCGARRALRLGNALEQHLPDARKRRHGNAAGEFGPARALDLAQRLVVDRVRHIFQPCHEVGEVGKVGEDHGRIGAGFVLRGELVERAGDIALDDMLEQVDDPRPIGKAEHRAHGFDLDRTAAMGDRLIEQRQAVARRAFRCPRHHRQRLRIEGHALLAENGGEEADQIGSADAPEIEALAARQDGNRNLADFGRGENELHMLRRLFERLQQAIEGLRREHVHFVDDIDLVARGDRPIAYLLDDLADIVDPGMRGGVHLDHVDMAAVHDRLAMFAGDAQVDGGLVDLGGLVVQRPCQDTRRRRLADAANAGQHVGLGDAAGFEGVGERAHHRLLADHQVGEVLGAVFARQNTVGGRFLDG